MTHDKDGLPGATEPGGEPHEPPADPNPYSQLRLPPNPYSPGADYAFGPAPLDRDPYSTAPDSYRQPDPYGQQAPNPYRPAARYPASRYPGSAAPTAVYPAWAGPPPAPPPRRKRSAAPWVAAAVVFVLFAVGGVVGLTLGTAAHAPELQVEAYLDAVTEGNAEEALALVGTEVDETDLLLTNEAYRNADNKITRYTVTDSTVDGDFASVTATLTQGGERYDQEFSLVRTGREAVIFDVWALDAPALGTVSVGVSGPDDAVLEVGGVDASSARRDGVVELRAFPGTYAVTLGGDTTWYDAEPTSVSVVGFRAEAEQAEPVVVRLTDEGTRAATDAVNAWLDACIASTELAPAGCPFSALNSGNFELSNLVWTVTKPVFGIGEYADGGWPVFTEREGEATATANARDPSTGGTGTIFTDPFPFDIRGVIEGFTSDGATFAPAV